MNSKMSLAWLKTLLAVILACGLFTACSRQKMGKDGAGSPQPEGHSAPFSVTDNRMDDVLLLGADKELELGDLGIMRTLNGGLVRVYPNYSITPLRGNYVNNVIEFARLFIGTPYEYGSNRNNPQTFDCSDFTRWAYLGALGMDIPQDSRSQAQYVSTFGSRQFWNIRDAEPGDLLFFMEYRGYQQDNYRDIDPATKRISHVGIYLGNGNMIHTASQATGGVRTDYLYGKHLEWRFVSGGSVLP
ncbi:MAG: hypothetical protein K0R57_800 [Paenibacillaceae bacterium]|jgi:hypothetical protein|nr:hypothetical protein [Paenibacillaceae bacterium]